jgi:hypothetical protein
MVLHIREVIASKFPHRPMSSIKNRPSIDASNRPGLDNRVHIFESFCAFLSGEERAHCLVTIHKSACHPGESHSALCANVTDTQTYSCCRPAWFVNFISCSVSL